MCQIFQASPIHEEKTLQRTAPIDGPLRWTAGNPKGHAETSVNGVNFGVSVWLSFGQPRHGSAFAEKAPVQIRDVQAVLSAITLQVRGPGAGGVPELNDKLLLP